MQQSKIEHISEQEAKDRLEQQAGLSFEYAHAQYNKNLRQWSFAVKNKAGAVVFSAVSFKDFAPYRALARHLNTSFEEVLDRYVFVYGAQHECGQGQDDERYCLIDKGWLKIADIEEAFIKKFGQYRKDYEMHDELWVLTIDGSECSSSTYKKHPKPGWPPRAERAAFALEELESQALQLALTAFLTPAEQPLSTSDKEPSTEPPQTAPHSQKPVQPTEPAVSNTDTGKPKKPAKPDGSGTDTGKSKKQNEHKGTAQSEPEKRGSTDTKQDYADALYNIAIDYYYGLEGLKEDKATALKWYRKAADKGHAEAMNMVGLYYGEGRGGLEQDKTVALDWYRKAADKDYVAAMYNIAIYYHLGLGGLKADKTTALKWFRKAADKGHADAMCMIGRYYDEGWGGLKKDEATALEWYRKAADKGNASALYNIAIDYQNGLGGLKKDEATALEWYRKAADKGHADAMCMIGQYYHEGWGWLEQDKAAALEWFQRAADKGNAVAMYNIAVYYQNDFGGLKADKATALEWYRKAADKGNADAAEMLKRLDKPTQTDNFETSAAYVKKNIPFPMTIVSIILLAILCIFLLFPIINPLIDTRLTITFAANKATEGKAPHRLKAQMYKSVIIPDAQRLRKDGYIFYGWNTEPDGSGFCYKPSEAYSFGKSVTLYAQWGQEKFVHTQALSLRKEPSTDAKIIATLSQDMKIIIFPDSKRDETKSWVKAEWNDTIGYVNDTYLRDFKITEILLGYTSTRNGKLTQLSTKSGLKARDICFLTVQARIESFVDDMLAGFKIKIINPYNETVYSSSSGYTYTVEQIIHKNDDLYNLDSWGNPYGGYYYFGKWSVEIWYANPLNPSNTNACIASKSFSLY